MTINILYILMVLLLILIFIMVYNKNILNYCKETMYNKNTALTYLDFNTDLKYYYNKILENKVN